MGLDKKVVRTKIKNRPKHLTRREKALLNGEFNANADLERRRIEERQEEIDRYNFETCAIIDPHFDDIQFSNDDIIIRLHKENYVKEVEEVSGRNPIYDAWISQVDGRMHKADREKWIDNPFPYAYSGVIVHMSPLAKAFFKKKKKSIEEVDKNIAKQFKVPEVGDIATLNHFRFADFRYYANKQKMDFVKNPNEYRIVHWEGYVKLHPGLIETVYKNKKAFDVSSPYREYKKKSK